MAKLNFQQALLPSSVSHDPSEIICWFAAQETFLIIINVENSCAAKYFVEAVIHFSGFYYKKKVLFEIEYSL